MDYKIFFDTNCLIDIFEQREDNVLSLNELEQRINFRNVYISALSVANIHYISKPPDIESFQEFIMSYKIVDLSEKILNKAFDLKMKDFEDAIQLASAMSVSADFLLTWNTKDYRKPKTQVRVMTPKEYLKLLR